MENSRKNLAKKLALCYNDFAARRRENPNAIPIPSQKGTNL